MKLKYRKNFIPNSPSYEIVYCQGIRAEGHIICSWHIKQEALLDSREIEKAPKVESSFSPHPRSNMKKKSQKSYFRSVALFRENLMVFFAGKDGSLAVYEITPKQFEESLTPVEITFTPKKK